MLLSVRNFLKGPYFLYNEETLHLTECKEPLKEKWLPGDYVDIDTKKVIRRTTPKAIIGIVDFLNRTGQGFSARGIPLYMFHPLNQGYPPMIVSAKTNPKANQFATVSFEHWDNKWPRAGIQTVLGPVGNIEIEKTAHIQARKIPSIDEPIQSTIRLNKVFDGFTFHIDPEGCQDVDDVMMWRTIEDGSEFGIGIADVAAWIHESDERNKYAKQLGQTIYKDGIPIMPMLPENISTKAASLRSDGSPRPIVSLVYTIKQGKCTDMRWEQHAVIVNRTYTYESILEDKEVSYKLRQFLEAICGEIGDDTHHWVELAMILYNMEAAKLMKQHKCGLLRSQPAGKRVDEWADLALKTGLREIAFFGYGAGKYVPESEEQTEHTGLGLQVYCHSSSPLRRYADLYNQRCLKHILFNCEKPKENANWHHLNEQAKQAKDLERELWFLEHLKPHQITEVEGIVIKQKSEQDKWGIYVPCWKRRIVGKTESPQECKLGDRVNVRAYTNLSAITNRIVCSFKVLL